MDEYDGKQFVGIDCIGSGRSPRVANRTAPCPHQLGEGMTGSRTNPALPQRICASHLEKDPPYNNLAADLPASADSMHRASPQRQDRSSSLRCGRSVSHPGPSQCCLPGGRKPAKPLVNNPV